MSIARRHRAALAIATLGAVIGVTPIQVANADSVAPAISAHASESINLNGTPGDVTISVTAPPAADAYVQLIVRAGTSNLRITDEAGNVLPYAPSATGRSTINIGAADSNNNGIPGTALSAGDIHLRMSASYPSSEWVWMDAVIVDGATGKVLASTGGVSNHGPYTIVRQPFFSTSWLSSDNRSGYGSDVLVDTGDPLPVAGRLQTQMMPSPPAETHTRLLFPAQEITAAGYTAEQLATAVHVQFSADNTHYTLLPWVSGTDGSLALDFPAIHWPELFPYEYLHVKADWGLLAGSLKGRFQTLDDGGMQFAGGQETFRFFSDVVPASLRSDFLARDSSGVLWQYEGTGQAGSPLRDRQGIGGGWQAYNALTRLSTMRPDHTGDLVARDGSGVLWYYLASGNDFTPFGDRIRLGGGWQIYNAIVGAWDITGDGHPDLLARDASGGLWLYPGTGNPSAPFRDRVKIGAGWNIYNTITSTGDLTGDRKPDLIARDAAGDLWLYPGTGNPAAPFGDRVKIGFGWGSYNAIVGPGDLTGDGHQDLLARGPAGELWMYPGTGNPSAPFGDRVQIGHGWGIYNTLI